MFLTPKVKSKIGQCTLEFVLHRQNIKNSNFYIIFNSRKIVSPKDVFFKLQFSDFKTYFNFEINKIGELLIQ